MYLVNDGLCPHDNLDSCSSCNVSTWDPVCANGTEYGNSCLANCRGVHSYAAGACPKRVDEENECNCLSDSITTCLNGVEYTNVCFMTCATGGQVEGYTTGLCAAPRAGNSCTNNVVWSVDKTPQQILSALQQNAGYGCNNKVQVTFSVTDGCGNAATTIAYARPAGAAAAPVITHQPKALHVACDARCDNQYASVTAQVQGWLASHGCADVANSDGVTWTASKTAAQIGTACGTNGMVTFTATNECGESTSTMVSYTISNYLTGRCDVCGHLPDQPGTYGTAIGPCDSCENGGKVTSMTLEFIGANGGTNQQDSKFFVIGDPASGSHPPSTVYTITNDMNSVVKTVTVGQMFVISTLEGVYRLINETDDDDGFVSLDTSRVGSGEDTLGSGDGSGEALARGHTHTHTHGGTTRGHTGKTSGTGGKFPAQLNIYIHVNGIQVSHVSIHASCSVPLLVGDQFGSLILRGFSNTAGVDDRTCTPHFAGYTPGHTAKGSTPGRTGGSSGYKPKLRRITLRWHSAVAGTCVSIRVSGKSDTTIFSDVSLASVCDQQVITLSVENTFTSFRISDEGVPESFRIIEEIAREGSGDDENATDRRGKTAGKYGGSNTLGFPSEMYIYVNNVYYFAHVSCSVPIVIGEHWAETNLGYLKVIQFERTDGKTANNCYGGYDADCDGAYTAFSCAEYGSTPPPSLPPSTKSPTTKTPTLAYVPPTTKPPTKAPTKQPTLAAYVQPVLTPPPTKNPTTAATTVATTTDPSGCCDKRDTLSCTEWKNAGYCAPGGQYWAYMNLYCAKTCLFCGVEARETDPPSTASPTSKAPTVASSKDGASTFDTSGAQFNYECTGLDVCSTGARPTSLTFMYVGFNLPLPDAENPDRSWGHAQLDPETGMPYSDKVSIMEPGPLGKSPITVRFSIKRPSDGTFYTTMDLTGVDDIYARIGDEFTITQPEGEPYPWSVTLMAGKWKSRFQTNCRAEFPLRIHDQFGPFLLTGYTSSADGANCHLLPSGGGSRNRRAAAPGGALGASGTTAGAVEEDNSLWSHAMFGAAIGMVASVVVFAVYRGASGAREADSLAPTSSDKLQETRRQAVRLMRHGTADEEAELSMSALTVTRKSSRLRQRSSSGRRASPDEPMPRESLRPSALQQMSSVANEI